MKTMISSFIALIIVSSHAWTFCRGQDTPEVELIKFNWRKLQQAKTPDPQKTKMEDILGNHNKQYETGQPEQGEARRTEPDETEQPESDEVKQADTMGDDISKKAPELATRTYQYRLRIKNSGNRTITALAWAYIFTDPISEKELLRHSFESKVKIKSGKEKEISVFSDDSPPNVVNAKAQNKKAPWKETVIIEKVRYSDGSVWNRP